MTIATYRFMPWVRRGIAAGIDTPESAAKDRVEVPVTVRVNENGEAAARVRLYGPGDIVGIDARQVVRVEPKHLTADFEPNYFTAIEFDRPDFPWMFTPAGATGGRLRPWICLIVVRKQEGVSLGQSPGQPLPVLEVRAPAVPAVELPDLADSWAWAHAQVIAAEGAAVADALAGDQRLNLSRLVCPKRLQPNASYIACVVPTFTAGVAAGLGLPIDDAAEPAALQPAWGSGGAAPAGISLPVYFHWEFSTGAAGDFEALVRRLRALPAPDGLGERPTYIGRAGSGIPSFEPDVDGAIVAVEGALRRPDFERDPWADPVRVPFQETLRALLNASQDKLEGLDVPDELPPLPVPLYGGRHARALRLPDDHPRWLRELNADPRDRSAAGTGARVVIDRQEEWMHAAWSQIGAVEAANRLLRLGKFARLAATRLHAKHAVPLPGAELVQLTSLAHGRIRLAEKTLKADIAASSAPNAAATLDLVKVARPSGPIARRVEGDILPAGTFRSLASGSIQVAPDRGLLDGIAGVADLEDVAVPEGETVSIPGIEGGRPIARDVLTSIKEADVGRLLPVLTADTLSNLLEEASIGIVREVEVVAGHLLVDTAEVELRVAEGREGTTVAIDTGTLMGTLDRLGTLRDRGRGEVSVPERATELRVGELRAGGLRANAGNLGSIITERGSIALPELDTGADDRFKGAVIASIGSLVGTLDEIDLDEPELKLSEVGSALISVVHPRRHIEARLEARLTIPTTLPSRPDPLDEVMGAPSFPQPAYEALRDVDDDLLLPGLERLEPNTVTLLETNQRFIEAYMVGLNHEMARELLWREYPTDQRGTYFRRFWNRLDERDDITPIHQWRKTNPLGMNAEGDSEGQIVLTIRGDLLRRYPGAVIYAVQALWSAEEDQHVLGTTEKHPIFRGSLDPDVALIGFDLTEAEVRGNPDRSKPQGWFFVIQEQPTEPRFGLDDNGSGFPPAQPKDVSWSHTVEASAQVHHAPALGRLANRQIGPYRWGVDAAQQAAITLQQPVRVAIHADEILKEEH